MRPKYDRSRMKAGIVHVGVDGFHRSHEAHYTDELMGAGYLAGWGICGCGLEGNGPKDVWSVEETRENREPNYTQNN
jgi:mannitol 2-dehydrogenase